MYFCKVLNSTTAHFTMTYNANVVKIIEKLKFFVNELSTKEQYRKSSSDFSRQQGSRIQA